MSESFNILEFFNLVENLKKTKRTGWVNHNIPMPESISDHMYRMAIMAMTINDENLDRNRCIKMALVHDMAKLVKDLDKYEMIVQAYEYEKEHRINLDTFFNSTKGVFQHPIVLSWVDTLYKKRAEIQYKDVVDQNL
ncbi:hypothetical protein BB558_004739 [Smittium angustum]|uniref:HD domain-containing protein n=1 Tax=Smittium angustum TaxID=133377 RepID=A0A2U1J2D8_SMIAN|nr:hypothetical protein BB558_004739 [Smittium angustum]